MAKIAAHPRTLAEKKREEKGKERRRRRESDKPEEGEREEPDLLLPQRWGLQTTTYRSI